MQLPCTYKFLRYFCLFVQGEQLFDQHAFYPHWSNINFAFLLAQEKVRVKGKPKKKTV